MHEQPGRAGIHEWPDRWGNLGSGDLDVNGVGRDLRVRSMGSGDISHHGVAGKVEIPRDHD